MEQSLLVFEYSFHSFYILGVKKRESQLFGEKIVFGPFYKSYVQMFTNWSR